MTFDADPALWVVFAHVFARVVSKGLKFDPQEAQPPANKQSRLCEVRVLFFYVYNLQTYMKQLIKGSDVSIPGFIVHGVLMSFFSLLWR